MSEFYTRKRLRRSSQKERQRESNGGEIDGDIFSTPVFIV